MMLINYSVNARSEERNSRNNYNGVMLEAEVGEGGKRVESTVNERKWVLSLSLGLERNAIKRTEL